MLMRETPLFIDGPEGQLEALYQDVPDARGVALICHPNPIQGGTMLNKVVSTLQRTARDQGLITLRFNYRGVGASAGTSVAGPGEIDDAQAAAKWLRAQHPDLPMTLFGFSFGGYVAANLGGRLEGQGEKLTHLFLIAAAASRLKDQSVLPQACPLTIIQPEDDEVIDPETVYEWSVALQRPHELLKVAECGHFFHGKLTDLKDLLLPRLSN
ncbi:Esterase/lipase/thioesterase family protein [Pseudomonas amygdali pv. eriobotryae]|uniref:Alpha/beta hydrolase n=3 Tax=Pseudomonas syringae group TaxID=136849 RepID=A0A0P9PVL3_PSEA0|nr:Esterase/lipase/thioesterase family protein [Pseudomonas amygdali pv. eriobotryae]RMS78078.1 Esterase/lipase/thioesterase protein [Pseudomonas savastanoi]RML99261.1 Esterase/lipase/thioesterase protein [Pseudomonas amygdali pv. eriobotryae]RMO64071.1 Esterase/lipase/thioesterase protein [Pseudomonas amygdali pv. eriobotryae]GFZ60052.1 alpha/beta hydrolase [Pseudomonas amygdali pv. eriobotryae]